MLSRKIEDLSPITKELVEKAISILNEKNIDFFINETYRSLDVQEAYYASGRKTLSEVNILRKKAGLYLYQTDKENIVITKAMPGTSAHNYRLAIDIYPLKNGKINWNATKKDFARIYEVLKSVSKETKDGTYKLEAGLDWTSFIDMPHWQLIRYNKDKTKTSWKGLIATKGAI